MTDATPPPPFEQQKWIHEMRREDAQRAFDRLNSRLDMIDQAAIKTGDGALRAGLLINGGAAVSVLAFIGSLATKELIAVSQLSRVASSLELFAYGVAAAAAGLGFSYLTHLFEAMSGAALKRTADFPFTTPTRASKRNLWFRGCAHVLAVIAFLACIGFFISGMFSVRGAIDHLPPHAAG